jgi:hypothetical protein
VPRSAVDEAADSSGGRGGGARSDWPGLWAAAVARAGEGSGAQAAVARRRPAGGVAPSSGAASGLAPPIMELAGGGDESRESETMPGQTDGSGYDGSAWGRWRF